MGAAAGGGIGFGFVLLLGEGESIGEVVVNRIFSGGILEEIAGGGIGLGFVLGSVSISKESDRGKGSEKSKTVSGERVGSGSILKASSMSRGMGDKTSEANEKSINNTPKRDVIKHGNKCIFSYGILELFSLDQEKIIKK
ncbi:MAG: hypothetical protein LBR92_03645 [Puniceicoccales bacterium]|nr:hypothetical protein [Puniceicoccales bacterium]